MSESEILQLYPPEPGARPLKGLYLAHDLRSNSRMDRPFVYTNFITSLDGRIAISDEAGELYLPDSIKNDRDWRLFQELAVQADLLFTSGRYLREYAAGGSQEILQVYDDPRFEDLLSWRAARGLPDYPDLAVISASADFSIPEAFSSSDRRVYVVTTESADRERLARLADRAEICIAGKESVNGGEMVRTLFARGYRWMYNTTGPKVLHLLVSSGTLDRLYLTQTGRLVGGTPYATIVEGDLLEPPVDFKLVHLYFDPIANDGLGQVLSVFERL
jgi:riboflavin biosynthesis pyrimidine reductase